MYTGGFLPEKLPFNHIINQNTKQMKQKKLPCKSRGRSPAFLVMLIMAFSFCIPTTQAQEAITSGGGNISNQEGVVSFSIGQLVFTTIEGDGGTAAQGVQQSLEWLVTDVVDDLDFEISINAFPNPTTDDLFLEIENYERNDLSYQLFNLEGELIASEKINEDQVVISMSRLPASVYILRVMELNENVKTIRIVKH